MNDFVRETLQIYLKEKEKKNRHFLFHFIFDYFRRGLKHPISLYQLFLYIAVSLRINTELKGREQLVCSMIEEKIEI